jgi:TonB family protein
MRSLVIVSLLGATLASTAAGDTGYEYRVSAAGAPMKTEAALYFPRPQYPREAQSHHMEGLGWYQMTIRPDGRVEVTTVLRSTGHALLDRAVVAALSRWRFRSGAPKLIRTPVIYTSESIHQFAKHAPDLTPQQPGDGFLQVITNSKDQTPL